MAGKTAAVAGHVKSGVLSAARNRSSVAVFIYAVTFLILVFILISRQSKVPAMFEKLTKGFSVIWNALTSPTRQVK